VAERTGRKRVEPEDLWPEEVVDWVRLTPLERWEESARLLRVYLDLGGSLDPEPDTQSPFYDPEAPGPSPADGRPGVHLIRRGGV
jgi:hypothetical protein